MNKQPTPAAQVRIAAPPDDLCLRFVNTRYWRGSPEPTEELGGLADLLRWAGDAGMPAAVVRRCAREWRARRHETAALQAAIRLREAILGVFAGLASGREPTPAALAELNAALALAPPRRELALSGAQRGWAVPIEASLPTLLAPVLWSAGDLALGRRAARVRQCANPACQWLFLDDSKSGNRRWCSMSACGNRAKAHRHYVKTKQVC